MSTEQSAVERLADQWNATPDWAPTVYDHGRVDQRHEMTMQLLEAIEADRAGVVAEVPEWEYDVLLTSPDLPPTIHRRRPAGPWVPVKQGEQSWI